MGRKFSPIKDRRALCSQGKFSSSYEKADYELVITPKMSFGTGHHETTQMMICFLLDLNFTDKIVLDMGTGTGVLSILAEKRGARSILAVG